ncbi:MAG: NAD(P)/FAD-dependent oxidoreductase [Limisphaerales bacterium]
MSRRILIIGGGVIGLTTAFYCAKRGWKVTLVERNPERRDGCSFGNAGMIVPSHFVPLAAPGAVAFGLKWMWNPASPFYIKPRASWDLIDWGLKFWRASTAEHVRRVAPLIRDLSFASRACYEELATLPGIDFGLVKRGLLMLCKTRHALDEEAKTAAQAVALGIPAEVLDAKQTAALDPNVRMDIAGAVYFPKDCHFQPDHFMDGLQNQLIAAGVEFIWNAEVTNWKVKSNWQIYAVLLNSGCEVEADEFILCCGSWSPLLARQLGLKIPIQAGKGYSLTLPRPRQLPQICAIFSEARVAVTPMGSALRFGGTMEMSGLNETISPVRVRSIIEAVPRYYPDFSPADFDGVQPWRGLRPCSPDGLPYIGRAAKFTNLTIAAGHAMMGMSLGPITGKLLAEIISGDKTQFDLTQLTPDRYN